MSFAPESENYSVLTPNKAFKAVNESTVVKKFVRDIPDGWYSSAEEARARYVAPKKKKVVEPVAKEQNVEDKSGNQPLTNVAGDDDGNSPDKDNKPRT